MGSQQPVLNGKDRDFQSHGLEEGGGVLHPGPAPFSHQMCELPFRSVRLTRALNRYLPRYLPGAGVPTVNSDACTVEIWFEI